MKNTEHPVKVSRLHWIASLAAAVGMRNQHDTPYSEMSVSGSYRSRYQFGFDVHKARIRAIKDRRSRGW